MAEKFKKTDFFNDKYEESFEKFLQLVEEDLIVRDFPTICYQVSNPPIDPLIIRDNDFRIKNPKRIVEEIAAIFNNLDKWKREESGMILWLFTIDKVKLHHVILTVQDGGTIRLYVSGDEEKYDNGIFWFWTYPFFYDYVVGSYFD